MMGGLHSETYGQGPTIVLLHGWAMHSALLREFAERLAEHARVICVDLPGHGRSPLRQSFTLHAVATEIIQALDEPPCFWLGWSLGALVALEITKSYPEHVKGLILMAGSPCFVNKLDWFGMQPELLDAFAAQLAENPHATALRFLALQVHGLEQEKQLLPMVKRYFAESPMPSFEVLQAGLAILKQQDLRPVLVGCACPVRVILGRRDTLVPVAIAPLLREIDSSIQVMVLDKAGHMPFLSHPDETVAAVLDVMQLP